MGWASGSYLAVDVWDLVRDEIPEEKRRKLAKKIYDMFRNMDADAWDGDSQLEQDMKRRRKNK